MCTANDKFPELRGKELNPVNQLPLNAALNKTVNRLHNKNKITYYNITKTHYQTISVIRGSAAVALDVIYIETCKNCTFVRY